MMPSSLIVSISHAFVVAVVVAAADDDDDDDDDDVDDDDDDDDVPVISAAVSFATSKLFCFNET